MLWLAILLPSGVAGQHDELVAVASWSLRFSPRASLSPPDAVLLEISASLRLFGGAAAIAAGVRHGLGELGLGVRIACAPTALAAHWLARCGKPGAHDDPDAYDWLAALDQLPLDALEHDCGCNAATQALLAGLGLRTLGEVRALPAAGLARRRAQAVSVALARARGEQPDPRPWFVLPERFHHRLALPAPTHHTDALLFASRGLLARLAAWLQACHGAIDSFELVLEHEHHSPSVIELVLGSPSRDQAHFALVARERLATLSLVEAVAALVLRTGPASTAAPPCDDLFGNTAHAQAQAALLLDRLRARLGSNGVWQIAPCPDHRPEAAWVVCAGARATLATPTPGSAVAACARPLWLLPTPRRIDAARFTLVSEAERIETGWWDNRAIRRDYYLAHGPQQALCWIFQALDPPQHWYVHGYFG